MNLQQALRQVQSLVRAAAWSESPTEAVFAEDSVIVSAAFDAAALGEVRYPLCVIAPGDAEREWPENPLFEKARAVVTLVVRQEGDRLGQYALTGGHRAASSGSSGNRGLLEVEERLLDAIDSLGPSDGESYAVAAASDAAPESWQDGGHVLRRSYTLDLWLNGKRTFPSCWAPTGPAAGGTVTLAWYDPPSRYDLLNIHVRRISGSLAPTLTTGTSIGPVTLGTQTLANAPGSGTWTYGIWGAYDETGGGTAEKYSDAVVSVTATV